MENMRRWYAAAEQRFSVRKYEGAPDEGQMNTLGQMAGMLCAHGIRVVLGRSDSVFRPIFLWYGRVTGTDVFAAIIAEKGAAPEMTGYVGEAFILECTAMGLGTCWLGGSYSKQKALSAIPLAEGERIVCITPIGVPGEPYAARPRRSVEKLTGLTEEDFSALPEWQRRSIECARRAPSAINRQPWRFRVEADGIAVENTSGNFGYGELDCGIAMLHIELGAAQCGVYGEWTREEGGFLFTRA